MTFHQFHDGHQLIIILQVTMEDSETIKNLQGRLARRNDLLDVIRKAYHRDVIANNNSSSSLPLPSLDLRELEGFPLFSPQECELRIRPCRECGGQVEIIHRESSRIVQYKNAIQQMEEVEIDLKIALLDAKTKAKRDSDSLSEEIRRAQKERVTLMKQIERFKSKLSSRNAELEILEAQKADLEVNLEEQRPIVLEHKRLTVEVQNEKDIGSKWEGDFHEQKDRADKLEQKLSSVKIELYNEKKYCKQLELNLQQMTNRCKTFEDRSSNLEEELSTSQRSEKEHAFLLVAIEELKATLTQSRVQFSNQIQDLKNENKQLASEVNKLDALSKHKTSESDYLRQQIEEILQGAKERGSIAIIPENMEDKLSITDELISEYEMYRQETRAQKLLLISSMRSVFESCLAQETILKANNSELQRNVQIAYNNPNETTQIVIEHIENRVQSDALDWQSIINNEEDRQHIFFNLLNRQQMGHVSIEKAFEKERKRHDRALNKCRQECERDTEKMRNEINAMQQQLEKANTMIQKYEGKMIKLQQKYALGIVPLLTSTQELLLNVRKEFINGNNTFSKLREDYCLLRGVTDRLIDALQQSRVKMRSQDNIIEQQDDDIITRDTAIENLEEMLTSITHKYAEKERERLARVFVEAGVQASSAHANISTQIDLVQEGVLKNLNLQREQALLPGRIYNYQQFQMRENLSKSQLRGLIDKL